MKNKNIKTDLACERHTVKHAKGVQETVAHRGICQIHTMVVPPSAAREAGCARGTYHTLLFPTVTELGEAACRVISGEIAHILADMSKPLLTRSESEGTRVLIVGLGNRQQTADALGPMTATRVHATAHLKKYAPQLLARLGCAELAILTPGSAAQSGMESFLQVKAAVQLFCPSLVLAIDALSARSLSRLATTVQITDAGILPGAGVGNPQRVLSRTTLGCPIISIGVPTVTDTATFIRDTFASAGIKPPRAWRKKAAITEGCFVCPRDPDRTVERFSVIIADAINTTFGVPDL